MPHFERMDHFDSKYIVLEIILTNPNTKGLLHIIIRIMIILQPLCTQQFYDNNNNNT